MSGKIMTFGEGVKKFCKKYLYFIITFLCVGAITCIAIVASANISPEIQNTEVSTTTVVEFASPLTSLVVLKDYSDTELMFNSTLNKWVSHKAIEFEALDGSVVMAAYDGVVKDVYTNVLEGTVIVIEHENDIVTMFGSLTEGVLVAVGDSVVKGQEIGYASNTATEELDLGYHLHFEVWEDGVAINPSNYLNIAEK